MTDENIRQNVGIEIRRGDECIHAAEHLRSGGFHHDAVSRAYYAAFHHTRALLLTKGIEPRSHRGAIQLLGLHFVKKGLLSESAASDLAHLETYRELSDYNASAAFSDEESREEILRARRFIEACRPLLA